MRHLISDIFQDILLATSDALIHSISNMECQIEEEQLKVLSKDIKKKTILTIDKFNSTSNLPLQRFFTDDAWTQFQSLVASVIYQCPQCNFDSNLDSIGCDICNEWYHLNCLNLSKIPKNKWKCIACK